MLTERIELKSEYEEYLAKERSLVWTGKLQDYLDLLKENSKVNRLAHGRAYDMIMSHGFDEPNEEKGEDYRKYHFFDGVIFGEEKTLDELVKYFAGAARKMEIRKRILLLVGPVGGGKSTIVSHLKKGTEQYSKTKEGIVISIKGCPQHEDPLHLIPEELRPNLEKEHGVCIEGRLCPVCEKMTEDRYNGDIFEVPLERVVFSEKGRKGIGTFTPSDPKSQDISELTGSIDLSTIGEFGVESDPRAFRFDGELNIANRGMMEFIEMLKVDQKFLYNLLTLTQEQNIKTGRFALIYADEVIMSHTNEHEFQAFTADKRSEALHDRIHMIAVPYNLRIDDEIKIYEKLIREGDIKDIHIAPETLKVCSMVAVLSRLLPPKKQGISIVQKMLLYNGEKVADKNQNDARDLRDEHPREGMDGVSPRFIINALSTAVCGDGQICVNPIDALRAIKGQIEHQPAYTEERKKEILNHINLAREEYDKQARKEVQKAFVHAFQDAAQTILENYLDNAEASTKTGGKIKDPISGGYTEPNERLMRSIEEMIGISENEKKSFRQDIMIGVAAFTRKGEKFTYTSNQRLSEGIEKKLFNDTKDLIRVITSGVVSGRKLEDKDEKKLIEAEMLLIEKKGYCKSCARELVRYVGTLLNK